MKEGHSMSTMEETITRAVASGQTEEILKLIEFDTPQKSKKQLRRLLKASENFSVYGDVVFNSRGDFFRGMAF